MRVVIGMLLAGWFCCANAAGARVENVRLWAAPDSTRVVFDLSQPVEHQLSQLTDPYRVVVDIKDADLVAAVTNPSDQDRFIQGLRAAPQEDGILRVVIDLKKYANAKSFQLGPNQHYGHRLVLDLFADEAEQVVDEPLEHQNSSGSSRDVIIAIDAGHGGEDPGARGQKGTWEKVVVLQMARELARLINQERGMRAVLLRDGDYFLSLRKRIELARSHSADLFVSIHADAFRDRRVRGSSVFVLSQRGASSEHARWLAEQENASDLIGGVSLDDKDDVLASVLLDLSQTASLEASIDVAERVISGLRQVGSVHKRRVESAGFAVLKSPDMPSILVETAFISNPDEEVRLGNAAHQSKIAGAILTGLRSYFLDQPPEGTLLASQRRHVISRGDTLSRIAERYDVPLSALREVNNLQTDVIRSGQVLTIPGG